MRALGHGLVEGVRATGLSWLCLIVLLTGCGDDEPPGREEAHVTRVKDGDTVELADGRTVRYLLIDTPEIAHNAGEAPDCFAEEARDQNAILVVDRDVTLEYDEQRTDHFGRTLAYVYVGGVMVNETLVERGYGCVLVIPPNDRYAAQLESLEQAARAAGKGLWGACADDLPEACK